MLLIYLLIDHAIHQFTRFKVPTFPQVLTFQIIFKDIQHFDIQGFFLATFHNTIIAGHLSIKGHEYKCLVYLVSSSKCALKIKYKYTYICMLCFAVRVHVI